MDQFLKTYWKTLLFFGAAGLFGGFCTGLFVLESYPAEIQQQILAQGLNGFLLGVITAVQAACYGVVLGGAGIFLGKKVGVWKDEKSFTKKHLVIAIVVAVIGGLMMILPDLLFFGRYSEVIMDSYAVKPSVFYILGGVIYGGVIEEVMLRLFMMSLIAFLLHMILERKRETASAAVLISANVIAAVLFAAGHLPATFLMIGSSPLIIFRCFLLNGGFGLLFGWLYRKYGLRYAMIAHGGCHVVSKLIWILFL